MTTSIALAGAPLCGILACVLVGVLVLLPTISSPAASAASELFVSPEGSEGHPGTESEPLRTLERAQARIRALKQSGELPAGGVTVWLRGGVYARDRTFTLTTEDSGTAAAPIVYRSYAGEEVRISGGREVTGFKAVTDLDILARLDKEARSNVLVADLTALGVMDFGAVANRGWPGALHRYDDVNAVLARADPLVIRLPTFGPQQGRDSATPVPSILCGQLPDHAPFNPRASPRPDGSVRGSCG